MRSSGTRLVILLSLLYLVAYFYRAAGAVIADDLMRDLHLGTAELGTLSAALFYAFAFAQLPLGPLLDRYPPTRVILIFSLLTVTGSILFASASGMIAGTAGRILIGAGTSCILMGALRIYGDIFPRHRFATLTGLQIAVGNIGNLLATAPLAWIAAGFGWRLLFWVLPLVTLVLAVAAAETHRGVRPATVDKQKKVGWSTVLRQKSFWGIAPLAFFWYGSYMAFQGIWGGPYLQEVYGCSQQETGNLLLMIALGFAIGSPLAGRISDRMVRSRKWVIFCGMLTLFCALFALAGIRPLPPRDLLAPLFFLMGMAVGTGPVMYAHVRELFPPQVSGTALTLLNFFVVIGAAVLQQGIGMFVSYLSFLPTDIALAFSLLIPAMGLFVALIIYTHLSPDARPEH